MNLLHLAWAYFRRRPILAMAAGGIALGVAMVFATLAVVNGFLAELEGTIRGLSGDVVVRPFAATGGERGRAEYERLLRAVDGTAEVSPRLNWFGLVGRRGARAVDDPRAADLSGLLLVGVEPALERDPEHKLGLARLAAGDLPPLLLGSRAAERLGVAQGDRLEVVSYRGGARNPLPIRASFQVAGTFHTGQYEQDLDRALVRREDLARIAGLAFGATEFVLRGAPGVAPEVLAERTSAALEAAQIVAAVHTWQAQAGKYLAAIQNQRGILSLLFFVIVLVAAYELFATLILTVAEKRRDMGVLGALGAGPRRIAGFFVGLCVLIASIGTALGVLLGVVVSRRLEVVERLINGRERIFHPELYQFDQIPVDFDPASIALLVAATLVAALIASALPALLAVRTPVVQALHEA